MRRHRPRFFRLSRVARRRAINWVDRRAGGWLEVVPSWGGSILLHGLMLLLLALIIYTQGANKTPDARGQFASQLTEDLTSLSPSDHAGDPFTKLKLDEPPSLSLEKPTPDVTTISQPKLPDFTQFAADLASPDASRAASMTPDAAKPTVKGRLNRDTTIGDLGKSVSGLHAESLTAPFSGRQAETRARLIRREGGSVKSEAAVEAGLDWITRHQRADGSWSLNYHSECKGGCPPENPMNTDTAATGLALLPLLGAGHIHTEKGRYQPHVRAGLKWLADVQQVSGEMYTGGPMNARMYSHAIATMAVCEAYGLSKDPALKKVGQAAIRFIEASQNNDGGWRYYPGQAGDTSVFGWQMFALRSARLAGLKVNASVLKGCNRYLNTVAMDPERVTYGYMPGRGMSPVMTAEALLCRQYLGWGKGFPPLVKGAAMVSDNLVQSTDRNIYYWYYATQLLHNMQNKDWERWNVRVRDGLVEMQTGGDGCDRGSWDPARPQVDEWADSRGRPGAGRLFLTALSTLTLEVYYRYLPLYRPTGEDAEKLDADTKEPAAADAAPAPGAATSPAAKEKEPAAKP